MANSFIQSNKLFSYTATSCVRNDYLYNECRICVDICPEKAFGIVRNKLVLFESQCNACAVCIGSCPTEALVLESFDPNLFSAAIKREEPLELSCKKNTPCLAVFDTHHYIVMALESEISCDMTHCTECSLNNANATQRIIREKMAAANDFFAACGVDAAIASIEERTEELPQRRAIFRAAVENFKEGMEEEEKRAYGSDFEKITEQERQSGEPIKHILLREAIKRHIGRFTTTRFSEKSELFIDKTITFASCTNCSDCVQFCPTKALQATSDKQGIVIYPGQCIGCGICDHICKTDAISTKEEFDLVELAFNRPRELVRFEMVMCRECRCPYPYRGGDPICERCKGFQADFADMFTLARDIG